MAATVTGVESGRGLEQIGTLVAGAALSSTDYRFVKIDSTDNQVVVCGAGEEAIGIRLNSPGSGEAVDILTGGPGKITLGDTVTVGQKLKSDAAGAGVPATADKEYYGAIATKGGLSGDEISVIIQKGFISAS